MTSIHTIDPHLLGILGSIATGLILIAVEFLKGIKL